MSIAIECEHCGKKYNAPDSMAGKKIKCRNCGKIVSIPAGDDGPDLSALENLEASVAGEDMLHSSSAGSRHGTGGAGRIGSDPSKGIAHRRTRAGDTGEIAISDKDRDLGPPRRLSIPYEFAGAAVIDNIAPIVLMVLGLGWLALMAANSNDTGVGWVGMLRLGLYVLLYVALAFPLCYAAIKWASRQMRFMMPPAPALRAFGAFALPFAMAFGFWLGGQSVVMLILGSIIGSIIAGAAVWFLFRIQPQEMGSALGGATGAFGASVLASYLILLGVNAGMAAIFNNAETNELAKSPVAPGFAWDVPIKKPGPDKARVVAKNTTLQSTTDQSQGDPTTPRITDPATRESTTRTAPDPTTMRIATAGNDNTVDPNKTNPQIAAVIPGSTTRDTTATTRRATPPPVPTSPFVANATPAKLGEYTDIIYPVMPSNYMLVVRSRGENKDLIEQWTVNPLEKKKEKEFGREKDAFGGYALSPSGDLLARIITFPQLAVEVYSFNKGGPTKTFNADAPGAGGGAAAHPRGGAPRAITSKVRILGFGVNENVIVHTVGHSVETNTVEVLRTKGGLPLSIKVDPWEDSSGNPSISPDGTKLAVATSVAGEGGIDIYDLNQRQPKALKTFSVPMQPWVKPGGMAWSPKSDGVAAFWDDGQGRGFIVDCRLVGMDPRKPRTHRYETVPYPVDTQKSYGGGRTFDWLLADAKVWLFFGQYLVDVDTFNPIGDLGVKQARSQRVIDADQVSVQSAPGDGDVPGEGQGQGQGQGASNEMFIVTLKTDAINAKRAELKRGGAAANALR